MGKTHTYNPSYYKFSKHVIYAFIAITLIIIGCFWAYNIHKRYLQRLTTTHESFDDLSKSINYMDLDFEMCSGGKKVQDALMYTNPDLETLSDVQRKALTNSDLPGYNVTINNTNMGDEPWNHHKVSSVAIDPKVTFQTAYYYELDNVTYTNALKRTLSVSCSFMENAIKESSWSRTIDPVSIIPPQDVKDAYDACVNFIGNKLNTSPYFELPGDIGHSSSLGYTSSSFFISSSIQIVHDVFTSYKIHNTDKGMYLLNMDVVLYRENKYHGKHVRITCVAKKTNDTWNINIIALEIIGIVPEDQIALFPVVASDPVSVEQLDVTHDNATNLNAYIQCDVVDKKVQCKSQQVKDIIQDHANQYIKLADSKIALGY